MAGRCSFAPHSQKIEQETHGAEKKMLTSSSGIPVASLVSTLTVGPRGPILMEDLVLLEEMAHFVRERIPERVVHARGAGAFGYFEVTHDITNYCKASVFEYIGKKTPIAVRFSTTSGENGTTDLTREVRGFAVKFYTDQGNWDLVGNNSPVFFLRDPLLFPSLSRAQKRNPQTHLKDPNALWDFFSLRPETLHEVTMLFTDRGIPDGYRHMHGFGIHPFKLVNAHGGVVYCKFTYNTNQGIKNLTDEQASVLSGKNPEYAIKDLADAINKGEFPSWTLYIQVMTFEQANNMPFNPFDITKTWSHDQFPLIPVGRLTLNKNPENYFAEVEQLAFCPHNLVPGIEPSPDKILQARMLSYPDALRYRLGVNFQQIPVNAPKQAKVANYQRDGLMAMGNNQGNAPNYYPNSFGGPEETREFLASSFHLSGVVTRYDDCKEDNVSQVRTFYLTVLDAAERQTLCQNIAKSLKGAQPFIQNRAVKNFTEVHPDYGARVLAELEKLGAVKPDKQKKQERAPVLRQFNLF